MNNQSIPVLLLFGGGGTEHEISIRSAQYFSDNLRSLKHYEVHLVEVGKDGLWRDSQGVECFLERDRQLHTIQGKTIPIKVVIPCFHGFPGETGDIQSYFELIRMPYFGCGPEASKLCFNKISTKLWLDAVGVPNTPFITLTHWEGEMKQKAIEFMNKWGKVFVKASNQGSSVGCYQVHSLGELESTVVKAFQYSPFVLIEKEVSGRELEISAYEYGGQIWTSRPGEIICPSKFYSYEEKYAQQSKTTTHVVAPGLSEEIVSKMRNYALMAFKHLKLRHLSRIDFFLEGEEIYLNEINTFPGATSISLFPKMMESSGHPFARYIDDCLKNALS